MFNIDEFDGKQKIENTTESPKTIFTNIEDGKVIYVYNTRTRAVYKLSFVESSKKYTVNAEYTDIEKVKKVQVQKNGKIVAIVLTNIIAMFVKDGNIHFTAPDEVEFYE